MTTLAQLTPRIPAATGQHLEDVRGIEQALLGLPQVPIATHHVIHGGMYARTVVIPAGTAITGAFVQVPTVLILSGRASVLTNGETLEIDGYAVLPASTTRKGAFIAHTDTSMTMIFATAAQSVAEAEAEFTTEPERLASRLPDAVNEIIITGE